VRFLLDETLSPLVRDRLEAAGHDAVRVRDLGLARAPDEQVLSTARDQRRVVVTADADFGALLARTNARRPSVIDLRRQQGGRASQVAALIEANVVAVADELAAPSSSSTTSALGSGPYRSNLGRTGITR
jgi:predicted nuclease of predicted toxin-antitoxin system